MNAKKYGTAWLTAYACLLGIIMICRFISVLTCISAILKYPANVQELEQTYGIKMPLFVFEVMLVLIIIELAITIYALVNLVKRTESGYYANIVCLFTPVIKSLVIFTLSYIVLQENDPSQDNHIVFVLWAMRSFLYCIWMVPNYIYFNHRKHLFTDDEEESPIANSNYYSATNTISVDEMKKLKELYDRGILSEEEYYKAKMRYLKIGNEYDY